MSCKIMGCGWFVAFVEGRKLMRVKGKLWSILIVYLSGQFGSYWSNEKERELTIEATINVN